jgi:RNA polymerase sigma factor (sigma-70 family)
LASRESGGELGGERKLVELAQGGDRQAFAMLADRYWNSLYRWLYHLSHDRHTAEDLVQETMLKAFAALSSFQAGTNFRAWLYRIAYNSFVSLRRAEGSVRERFPDYVPGLQQGPSEELISKEVLSSSASRPATMLQRHPAERPTVPRLLRAAKLSQAVCLPSKLGARLFAIEFREKAVEGRPLLRAGR